MKDIKDIIRALRGNEHCDWCVEHPPSFMDCVLKRDVLSRSRFNPLLHRLDRAYDNLLVKIGLWKIGQRLHARHQHG